jgi:hypothetical protein
MKKFTVPRFLIAVVIVLVGFTLSSCNTDGPDVPPVKLEEMSGNYKGKLITVQGSTRKESVRDFKVKKTPLCLQNFPSVKL